MKSCNINYSSRYRETHKKIRKTEKTNYELPQQTTYYSTLNPDVLDTFYNNS